VVLVDRSPLDARQESLPDARLSDALQRSLAGRPAVEVADDGDLRGVRGEDAERDAVFSCARLDVRAQLLPEARVVALVEEEEVVGSEEGRRRRLSGFDLPGILRVGCFVGQTASLDVGSLANTRRARSPEDRPASPAAT